MTANELAVDLDLQSSQMEYGYAVSDWKLLSDSATMLRQQQAEIEKLKKENEDRESAIYATGYWNGISKKNERA